MIETFDFDKVIKSASSGNVAIVCGLSNIMANAYFEMILKLIKDKNGIVGIDGYNTVKRALKSGNNYIYFTIDGVEPKECKYVFELWELCKE